ncbi:MAG: hypothetical protein ACPGSC_05225 [Granulosicoccaceae bacterium]
MNIQTNTIALCLFLWVWSSAATAFEMPRGTTTSLVAEGIVQNGVEMDIVDVNSTLSPEEFLRLLMPIIDTKNGELVISEVANNAVSVGVINDKTYESIVISQGPLGTTKGIFSVAYLTRKHTFVSPSFQLPANSKLISYTQDSIRSGGRYTWVYNYDKTPTYLTNSIEQIAEDYGWTQNSNSTHQLNNSDGRYFSFFKSGYTSEILVKKNANGTAIVVMEQQ